MMWRVIQKDISNDEPVITWHFTTYQGAMNFRSDIAWDMDFEKYYLEVKA